MLQNELRDIPVVILAGGLGTRMQDHFPNIPKAMIPVRGKAFLQWQLELLKQSGLTKVLLISGHLQDSIFNFLSKDPVPGLSIEHLYEGEQRRGTGGALRFAFDEGRLPQKFFLMYGDSYLPVNYAEIWRAFESTESDLMMTVFRNQNRFEKGNVDFQEGRILLYDKFERIRPAHELDFVDYGLSVFSKDCLVNLNSADLSDFYHSKSLQKQIAGFEVKQRFYEIGSPQGLKDFEQYLISANKLS